MDEALKAKLQDKSAKSGQSSVQRMSVEEAQKRRKCRPDSTIDADDYGSHVTIIIMWSIYPQKHYHGTQLIYFQKA